MLLRKGNITGMNLTKDNYFIDTNIVIYLFDKKNDEKRKIAEKLLKEALVTSNGIVSFQVIQEFCNAALRKFEKPLTISDCKKFINKFLYPLCDIHPILEIYDLALDIKEETGYSFYDSMILASAIYGKCKVLLSEDLQNGQIIKGVKIVNPFK